MVRVAVKSFVFVLVVVVLVSTIIKIQFRFQPRATASVQYTSVVVRGGHVRHQVWVPGARDWAGVEARFLSIGDTAQNGSWFGLCLLFKEQLVRSFAAAVELVSSLPVALDPRRDFQPFTAPQLKGTAFMITFRIPTTRHARSASSRKTWTSIM